MTSAGQTAFADLLRSHRAEAELTQGELAERAGLSADAISALERGVRRRPHRQTIELLASALGLDMEASAELKQAARAGLGRSRMGSGTSASSSEACPADLSDEAVSDSEASQTTSDVKRVSPVPEERRLVTALFCDIVGFTSLPELDPEDVRDIQETYFSTIKHQIDRYGGVVEKYAGGSLVALFGIPLTHEDDPERAVLCALGIREAMGLVVAEADPHVSEHLQETPSIRVGIETGELVSGPRSAWGWEDIGVSGDAVNTAAGLQTSAKPGEILVGQETMHLTRSCIRYGDPRELNLAGRAPAAQVFPALGLNQGTEGLWQAVHEILPPAPFVGRAREMEGLSELWERARADEGQLVSIVGEPGIGKSRLIAEFVTRSAKNTEARLVQGRCLSYGQEVSLWLMADLLRSVFSIEEDDSLDTIRDRLDELVPALLTNEDKEAQREVRDVVGEVLGLSPSESMVTQAGAEIRRQSLVRSLRRILAALSSQGGAILVLQDLHWIDASSNEVLAQVAVDVPGLRLLVLVAQREGWTPPWSDLGWPERINLRPLPGKEAAVLAATLLGNVRLSAELENYLAERAGGNPFFVEELARALRETGALQQRDSCMHLIPDVAHRLPTTLAEVLQARLDRLDAPVKSMAQVGSVIGRSFAARLLAEVLGETQSALEAPLRALQQAEIALPRGHSLEGSSYVDLEYSFKHVTMREVAYSSLVRKRRRELHLKTARAIIALYPSDEYIETIAFHLSRTDADAEAAAWLEKAGDRATSIYANDTAETHYGNAIERLSRVDAHSDSSRVREKLADLLLRQSRYEEARTLYEEAFAQIPDGDRVWLARVQRKIGDVWGAQRSFLEQALARWDAAEETLGAEPPADDLAWWSEWLELQLSRMRQLYFAQRITESAEVAKRCRPIVDRYGTAFQRGRYFDEICIMTMRRDGYLPSEETIDAARLAVEALDGLGEAFLLGESLCALGFALLWSGAFDEAETAMLRALDLAERTGYTALRSMCSTYLTVLYRKRDDVDRVRIWNERSLQAADEAKRGEYVAMVAATRAWLAWKEDDLPAAETEARSAVADWQSTAASYPYMFWWAGLWILIDVAMRQERVADAIENAKMLFGPGQAKVPDSLAAVLHAAIGAWEGDDEENAKHRLTEALELAREMAYL
jgi:class 3 adenylate cyclase/tetratricopeptide (TPR) repeat protein/DNA-binding XRE family transcriptional regulator